MNDKMAMIIADKSKHLKTIFNKSIYCDIQQKIDDGDAVTISKDEYAQLQEYKRNYLNGMHNHLMSDEFMEQEVKLMYKYLEYADQQKAKKGD